MHYQSTSMPRCLTGLSLRSTSVLQLKLSHIGMDAFNFVLAFFYVILEDLYMVFMDNTVEIRYILEDMSYKLILSVI